MVLIIREKSTGKVHQINYYQATVDAQIVQSTSWPGQHIVGTDCEWVPMVAEEWRWIEYIKDNPESTIKQLSKELNVPYCTVYRLVQLYKLTIRLERKRREVKKKQYWGKYLNQKR